MNETRAFAPAYTRTSTSPAIAGTCLPGVIVAASNGVSVASTQLPGNGPNSNNSLVQFRVSNKTSVWVHVNFGVLGSVANAALTSSGIAPGTTEVFSVDPEVSGATVFADGAPAGSTTVLFHRGSGVS
jgi:hypothetical protein